MNFLPRELIDPAAKLIAQVAVDHREELEQSWDSEGPIDDSQGESGGDLRPRLALAKALLAHARLGRLEQQIEDHFAEFEDRVSDLEDRIKTLRASNKTLIKLVSGCSQDAAKFYGYKPYRHHCRPFQNGGLSDER